MIAEAVVTDFGACEEGQKEYVCVCVCVCVLVQMNRFDPGPLYFSGNMTTVTICCLDTILAVCIMECDSGCAGGFWMLEQRGAEFDMFTALLTHNIPFSAASYSLSCFFSYPDLTAYLSLSLSASARSVCCPRATAEPERKR